MRTPVLIVAIVSGLAALFFLRDAQESYATAQRPIVHATKFSDLETGAFVTLTGTPDLASVNVYGFEFGKENPTALLEVYFPLREGAFSGLLIKAKGLAKGVGDKATKRALSVAAGTTSGSTSYAGLVEPINAYLAKKFGVPASALVLKDGSEIPNWATNLQVGLAALAISILAGIIVFFCDRKASAQARVATPAGWNPHVPPPHQQVKTPSGAGQFLRVIDQNGGHIDVPNPAKPEVDPRVAVPGAQGFVLLDAPDPSGWGRLEAVLGRWGVNKEHYEAQGGIAAFSSAGATVALMGVDKAIKSGEVEKAAQNSWLWSERATKAAQHKAWISVTVLPKSCSALERQGLFTKVIAALLEAFPQANGVYLGSQTMVVPRDMFLQGATSFRDAGKIPLEFWVWIRAGLSNGKTRGYTFGLKEFGKEELEIVDSSRSPQEVMGFLMGTVEYLIVQDARFYDDGGQFVQGFPVRVVPRGTFLPDQPVARIEF